MGIESGTYIDDLNPAWPLGSDQINVGPQHFRIIKSTLQNTFPNITGAVTFSEEDLNNAAIKTEHNVFTAVASALNAGVKLESSNPAVFFGRTTAALDEKNWRISVSSQEMRLEMVNDPGDTITYFARFNRNAMAMSLVEFTTASFKIIGSLETTQPIHLENQDTTLSRSRAGHAAMEGIDIGYLNIPRNLQSVDYTCNAEDAGKFLLHPTGGETGDRFTIPASTGSVVYELGTVITFVNRSTQPLEITVAGTDTLILAGTSMTGLRNLAENGVASALKTESTVWLISGTGLS